MAITPYLYYRDVDAAMKFLTAAFGFRKFGRPMRGADGRTDHAAMRLGEDTIMMGRPPMKYRNPKQLGQSTQCLYINVSDVEKHFKRAKKAGAQIVEELERTEYGHLRYRAADPEGHEWAFAQELRGKPRTTKAK